MNFFNQVRVGVGSYVDAYQLIIAHQHWLYVIAPGIINCILFVSLFFVVSGFSNEVITWLMQWFSAFIGNPQWFLNTQGILVFVITIIIKIGFVFLYLSVYKYIVLIVMAPLLAILSERVENILTGKNYPFNWFDFLHDVVRGILLAIRNLVVELLLICLVFIIGFIPLINFITPALLFYISSYYYGFSMLDYSNERKRFTIKQSIGFISANRGVAFGNGAVFYLLLLIPFVGWIIAPALSVTAAAIADEKLN